MRQQEEGPHQQDEDEAAVLRVPGQECLSASANLPLSRTLFMYTGAVIEVIITSPL